MNEKTFWTGIAPSPAVLAQLDYEEMATLAMLSWCTATNRPVTSAELADLSDRDGKKLGVEEARTIVRDLTDMKIMSVFGMSNDRPVSVRLGGFQPRTPRHFSSDSRPAPGRPGSSPARQAEGFRKSAFRGKRTGPPPWVLKNRRVETGLEITDRTPSYVQAGAARLRERQTVIETGGHGGNLVGAAEARLKVLTDRIALYEHWLKDEPGHSTLAVVLEKKRKAVPEMTYQIERARLKQAVPEEGERRAG